MLLKFKLMSCPCENWCYFFFSLQVYAIFVLVVSLCLYTYYMPYRSKLANILELAMQLNFLVLLVLEHAPFVREDLFVFSENTDAGYCDNSFSNFSNIVILLAPIYYVPLLVICVVAVVYLVVEIRRLDILYYSETCQWWSPLKAEQRWPNLLKNSFRTPQGGCNKEGSLIPYISMLFRSKDQLVLKAVVN